MHGHMNVKFAEGMSACYKLWSVGVSCVCASSPLFHNPFSVHQIKSLGHVWNTP